MIASVPALLLALYAHARVGSRLFGETLWSSDEPAHFATGVMAYDYLRHSLGSNPFQYAANYYIHYPKIAIGHWPPVYYAVQACWYFFFPVSPQGGKLLSIAVAAAIAVILIRKMRDAAWGIAAAAVFLALPVVQDQTWHVYSDLLTAFFVLLAATELAVWLDGQKQMRRLGWFALWAAAAILTKGTAWALGPSALIAPVLTRRMACFRNPRFFVFGAGTLLLAAPFYALSSKVGMGYIHSPVQFATHASSGGRWLAVRGLLAVTVPLLVLAAGGMLRAIWNRWRRADSSALTTLALVMGSIVLGQLAMLFASPLTFESRAYLPSCPALAFLAAYALREAALMAVRFSKWLVLIPAAGATMLAANCGILDPDSVRGYAEAASVIPYRPQGYVILVSGDSATEGAIITERLWHERRPSDIVLRASRVLAESDWNEAWYRTLFSTADQVVAYLQTVPVRFIVIDTAAKERPHDRLLQEALRGDPDKFPLAARIPVSSFKQWRAGELRIYENRAAGDRMPTNLKIPTGLDRGRVFTYQAP
jgi:hypothetical protein